MSGDEKHTNNLDSSVLQKCKSGGEKDSESLREGPDFLGWKVNDFFAEPHSTTLSLLYFTNLDPFPHGSGVLDT